MGANRAQDGEGLYMTVQQYFLLDESSDAKYEYLDGYAYLLCRPSSDYDENAILDLASASPVHTALAMNVGYLLTHSLADGPCMVYSSDARVKLAENRYVYPDVTVACGVQEDTRYLCDLPWRLCAIHLSVLSGSSQSTS